MTACVAPDVSVIVPTFHREREVVEAVKSVLGQVGVTVEVIVIDDSDEGSARSAVEGLRDPRVRYVRREGPTCGNPCRVRNQGITLARGRFLHFLDDDDRLADGASAALVDALDRSPCAGAAFGAVLPFGADTGALEHEQAYFTRATERLRACRSPYQVVACLLFKEAPLINSSAMIRSDLARAIGGYDPRVPCCEDADLYLRAIRASSFAFVDRPVVHYRVAATSRIHRPESRQTALVAYRVMHESYRASHGWIEYALLKLLALGIR